MKNSLLYLLITITVNIFAQVPTTGLVGYWPFDGDAQDLSGNNNHGFVYNALPAYDRFGNPNRCYYFNGLNSFIEVANSSSISFGNNQNFTLAFWMKVKPTNNNDIAVVTKHNPGTWNGYMFIGRNANLGYCNSANNLTYYVAAGYQQDACANNPIFSDTANWYFVLGTYDAGLNRSSIYINGQVQSDIGINSGTVSNSANLIFGAIFDGWDYTSYYEGYIDGVRMYNRTLTQSEINALYNEANPNTQQESIVVCMPMDNSLTDYSGNNNHGTANGITYTTDRFGNANSACHFNGINNFVTIPHSSSIAGIEANDELTVSVWCKVNNWYQNFNVFPIINKYNSNTDYGWDFELQNPTYNSSNSMLFLPNYPANSSIVVIGGGSAAFNQWDFYAVTYSKSGNFCKLYKNGVLVKTATVNSLDLENTGTGNLFIGYSKAGPDEYANGDMDELKIYSRALSDAEIQNMYSSLFNCSLVTGLVNANKEFNIFNVYPNPTSEKLVVELESSNYSANSIELSVFSVDGKLIRKDIYKNFDTRVLVNVEDLQVGLYILQVKINNLEQNYKFIKR